MNFYLLFNPSILNFASELSETPVMRKKKKDVSAEDYDALRAEIIRLKKDLRHARMHSKPSRTALMRKS